MSNNICDCSNNVEIIKVIQCKACNDSNCSSCTEYRQRLIWNVARVPSSLYTMNLASQNVRGSSSNNPLEINGNVNWNQMSDRAVPSIPTRYVPRNRTRHRPGGAGSAAIGVDVKHDSYARFLARKKSAVLKTCKSAILPEPIKGNKQFSLGFISNCS